MVGATLQAAEEDEPPPDEMRLPESNEKIEVLTEPLFNATYGGPQFNCPAFSYMSPKLQCRKGSNGCGVFAIRNVKKDDLLIGWAGKIVHVSEILNMDESERTYILQIDDELFQIPFWKGYNEPADFVNHSCEPNAGFKNSSISLVAMRDILAGEEITFDYAMSECIVGLKGNEFDCDCGTSACRGRFSGDDWRLYPNLWEKYGDYFAPHIRVKVQEAKRLKGMYNGERTERSST